MEDKKFWKAEIYELGQGKHQSNFKTKIQGLLNSGILKAGDIQFVNTQHDEWCDYLNKCGSCNCDPWIYRISNGERLA